MNATGAGLNPAIPRPFPPANDGDALPRQERFHLFVRQSTAIALLEFRRLRGVGGLPLLLLAAAPLSIFGAWALLAGQSATDSEGGYSVAQELVASGEHTIVYAGFFQAFLLRLIVYFGCVAVFSNAFRREILDQTLHYSLLAPVRREALVAGKYVAGILAAGLVFMLMTVATQLLFYAPLGTELVGAQTVLDGLTYVGLTALAVIGYGALFLTIGLFVKNPIIPAVLILSWESASFVMPAFLQKLTIIHYLQQMLPVSLPDTPFAIPAVPTPAYLAVPGLMLVSGAMLAIAAYKVRRLEVSYGVD